MNEEVSAGSRVTLPIDGQEVQQLESRTMLGFWIYLMTDCILFATLFAVYAVLHNNTSGGAAGKELFSLPYVLTETLILLTSSFTCGLAMLAVRRKNKIYVLALLGITFLLGLAFVGMEVSEFHRLAQEGNSWRRSGFLSSFFTLVSTHGLHISVGLIWITVLAKQLIGRGFTPGVMRKLTLFSMFWHFLDIVWIFIFSIVYMVGAI